MAWRECTNCGYKAAPFEPRKRKGEHLLCKSCASLPSSNLKSLSVRKVADEEGTPGADLSNDFGLPDHYLNNTRERQGEIAQWHATHDLPRDAPLYEDGEMWPENQDMGGPISINPLNHPLPNSVWDRYAVKRQALGHPAKHRYRGKADPLHKAAHKDPDDYSEHGSHAHHPYVAPVGHDIGATVEHLQSHHGDTDLDKLADAAGDHSALSKIHVNEHEKAPADHGHPAGEVPHQHFFSTPTADQGETMADWEKELLGQMTTLEPGEGVKSKRPWPWKIKDHLKGDHKVDEGAISGSDLFNHSYHDDLHEQGADHSHEPKPGDDPYMDPLPEDSLATYKNHLVQGHGHNTYDTSYMSQTEAQQAHDKAHGTGEWSGSGNGADHQHHDDTQPPKYDGDNDAALKHLTDDHNLSVLDHGYQHALEKHKHIHAYNHSEWSQPHYHEGDDPFEQTPAPPTAPGGAVYKAMLDHLKSGNNHNGNMYGGWEQGESYDSMKNAHKNWHDHDGPHDHQHEDMNDPLDAGSTEQLQQAEQGKPQHAHHEDMSPKEYAEHMKGPGHEWSEGSGFLNQDDGTSQHVTDHEANDADNDHTHAPKGEVPVAPTPKTKKPNTNPQWGDEGAPSDPEMYAWPSPEVAHPKNKDEVIQHLQDHHPEVNAEDYDNSEFKSQGTFLKGWHAHLHSGKEHEISPSDRHTHVNDDSKSQVRPGDNVFSHLVTHHGYSEDQAKATRYVDAVSGHHHLHEAGDDEEIGHQHDYAGAPPSEPNPWFVNPEYAGTNHEHLIYHGTSNDYNCPTCGSSAGERPADCPDCGKGMTPQTATENKRQRDNWGTYGGNDWNCHITPHLTTLYQQAKHFGHRIIALKLKGKKPKYYDNLNHFAHDAYDRLHAMGELKDDGQYLGNHHTNSYGGCCSGVLLKYAKGGHRDDGKYGMRRVRDSLRKDGYDHIVVRNHADGPNGALNVFPLSPHQLHVHDENYKLHDSNDPRQDDSRNFRPPSGWSDQTLPHEKDKLRPPAYLVDKDPRLGETKHPDDMTSGQFRTHMSGQHGETAQYDPEGIAKHDELHASGEHTHHHGQPLPKSAEEHPDDSGDPEMGERGSDDDDEDNEDKFCSKCDTEGHDYYAPHCDECEEYTGDGDCSCTYCSACGYPTPHGDDPLGSEAHEYCKHCDNAGVNDGITDHDDDGHEDEYGEHPEAFKDKDYCPHCETHDKENRDSDDCNNCGATLPDYDMLKGSPKTKGQYPTPGGGTKQWDHTTHPWGHLVHDHGLNLDDEVLTPENLAAKHKAAHTGQLKDAHYDHSTGLSYSPHDPEHTHPEVFPQTKQWADMNKDEKVAHLGLHHSSTNAALNNMDEDILDHKHTEGHGYQYANSRTPHQHVEGAEGAPSQEHAPDNIGTHMSLFHQVQPHHVGNFTDDQLHLMHNEHHGMGGPNNQWHHEHTPDGVQLTGKHAQPPVNAADHIAAVEHMHEHHADVAQGGTSLPNLGYPMSSIESGHLQAHKNGPLAPHEHPVTSGPHPDEDPYGHLQSQHGWTDEQVAEHKDTFGSNNDSAAQSKHLFEHQHGPLATELAGVTDEHEHSHFTTPEKPIPAIPKAYKSPAAPWSQYEKHKHHLEDVHGFTAPSGQSGAFYKDLHHAVHHNPEAAQELGLPEGHDHHEHDASGGTPTPGHQHNFVGGSPYDLQQHLKDYHPEQLAKATGNGFNYNSAASGDATKMANDLHDQAHADAPDYVHTHKPDPNAPLHPDKGHLNDELMKHLVSQHGHSAEEVGNHPDHDSMVDAHIGLHGTVNSNGTLGSNYDDPHSSVIGTHSHSTTSMNKVHGADIVDGKPTKKISPTTEYPSVGQLVTHMKHDHENYDTSTGLHANSDPEEVLAHHEALHADEGDNQASHIHKSYAEADPEAEQAKQEGKAKDIAHIESHHGLVQHNLADHTPTMVKWKHDQMHMVDDTDSLPINHHHNGHGTDDPVYPPPAVHQSVHNPHDLAHHLTEHHNPGGFQFHNMDQASLLDHHAAAHEDIKGNAAKGLPEHTHPVMYPFGHEKGESPQTASALGTHLQQAHNISAQNKTPDQIAAAHEMEHQSVQGHKHSVEDMSALHKATPVVLPPKAVKPDLDSYEMENHLKIGHGMDYNAQTHAKVGAHNNVDWHAAEHAKGTFNHVHQKLPNYLGGIQQYPENPAPAVPEGKTQEHLANDHGIHVPEGEAETMHKKVHDGFATDHQHQPDEIPVAPHLSDNTHASMQNHLTHAHAFDGKEMSDKDIPALHALHESSHADHASLPFHSHLGKNGTDKVMPKFDGASTGITLMNHMQKQHGVSPFNGEGNYKPVEEIQAAHDAHHADHDAGGVLGHTHSDPISVPHHDPDSDLAVAHQHMQEHHGVNASGYSPEEAKSEHDYQHNYYSDMLHVNHSHAPQTPKAHSDMTKGELVGHLNEHHHGMTMSGGDSHQFYEEVHQAGHGGPKAPSLIDGGASFSPKVEHDHPDTSIAHPNGEQPTLPHMTAISDHAGMADHIGTHHNGAAGVSSDNPHVLDQHHDGSHEYHSDDLAIPHTHGPAPHHPKQSGLYEDDVNHHLKTDHGATVPGAWEEHLKAHDALHALGQPGHSHSESMGTVHAPAVPHQTNGTINSHLNEVHQVDAHHWKMDHGPQAHQFHTDLHASPEDENDSGHVHAAAPVGPQPKHPQLLHPLALNMDKHLENHGMHPSTAGNLTEDAKHSAHAAYHDGQNFGATGPHTHSKWTGEGTGIKTSLRHLVAFYEQEMAVD